MRSALTPREHAEEYTMMALRLTEGVERTRYIALNGADFDPVTLDRLENLGLITVSQTRVAATAQGRRLLNGLLRELLAD